jgi:transposase-like protein
MIVGLPKDRPTKETHAMAEGHRMTAADLVDKLLADEHADVLRDSVAWLVTELMEAEVGGLTGAGLGKRAPDRRQAQRNGYRPRRWDALGR